MTSRRKLVAGPLHFMLIERAGHLGIRVRDSVSPNRLQFKGLQYFPVRADWHIEAHFEPYVPEHHIPIVNILGMTEDMTAPGAIVFEREGRSWRLDAILEAPGDQELFVMFRMRPVASRPRRRSFSVRRIAQADRIEVDFNEAFNPPVRIHRLATCPLPPRQNRLALAIDAANSNTNGRIRYTYRPPICVGEPHKQTEVQSVTLKFEGRPSERGRNRLPLSSKELRP